MVVGAQTEKADKEEQMKQAWLANNSYGPVSLVLEGDQKAFSATLRYRQPIYTGAIAVQADKTKYLMTAENV